MARLLAKGVRPKDWDQNLKRISDASAEALGQVQKLLPRRRRVPRIGLVEVLVILAIALVIFGAGGKGLGRVR